MSEKLFIGLEESNIAEFVSPCCNAALSIEPLSRLCCGQCGKPVKESDAIRSGPTPKQSPAVQAKELHGCGDCDPCIGGRPDQCALGPYELAGEPYLEEKDANATK